MIVAAGLTPAWQQILRFEQLELGEVNRAAESHWCASGKVLNVGLALAHLGAECVTVAPLGGLAGEAIRREFVDLDAAAEWVDVAAPTRVCTTLLHDAGGATTELVENARALSSEELEAYIATYARRAATAQYVVLSGSLPEGTPVDFYSRLLSLAPCDAVLDIRGPELLAVLDAGHGPLVVKPNREELARTLGRSLEDDEALGSAVRELVDRGAQWVVVTQGKHAVFVAGEGAVYRATPPAVSRVVNPIGCGDSMAAAIAWRLSAGGDVPDAVRYGIAAAAQNLAMLLPCRLDAAALRSAAENIQMRRLS